MPAAAAAGINGRPTRSLHFRRRHAQTRTPARGDTAMSDDHILLDHARRYFSQAGQSTDMKKMKMLAELGLEFLRLAHHGAGPRGPADAAGESTGAAAPPAADEPRGRR